MKPHDIPTPRPPGLCGWCLLPAESPGALSPTDLEPPKGQKPVAVQELGGGGGKQVCIQPKGFPLLSLSKPAWHIAKEAVPSNGLHSKH